MLMLRRIFTDGKRWRSTVAMNGEVVVTMSGKSPSASISPSIRETKSARSGDTARSP